MTRKNGVSDMSVGYRVACFMRDADPYEFQDSMEVWETEEEALCEMAANVDSHVSEGNVQWIIDILSEYDLEDQPETEAQRNELVRILKAMKPKATSKNRKTAKRRSAAKKVKR